MPGQQRKPAKWSEPTTEEYRRLLRLAARRLKWRREDADDVVSRALIKFAQLPEEQRPHARIEQIVKTEVLSHLRSEQRADQRNTRATNDRALGAGSTVRPSTETELMLLRRALAEAADQAGIRLTYFDLEFVELCFAGFSKAEIQRELSCSRHEVRRSADRWARVVRAME